MKNATKIALAFTDPASYEFRGVVRLIDSVGRIVIPKEIRDYFKIKQNSSLEIFQTNDGILLIPVQDEDLNQ